MADPEKAMKALYDCIANHMSHLKEVHFSEPPAMLLVIMPASGELEGAIQFGDLREDAAIKIIEHLKACGTPYEEKPKFDA